MFDFLFEILLSMDISYDLTIFWFTQMSFHHSCKAKYVGTLNDKLSVKQKESIADTSFWWLMSLNHSVKISQNLLFVLFML